MRKGTGRLTATALTGVALVALAGCGSTRSVEAFCATMDKHKQAYLSQMDSAQNGGALEGLFTAVSAIGDLKLMWKELADVAPDDIRADAEAVSEAWQKQEDSAGAGDWMASLSTAFLNSGSMTRIDSYTRTHCSVV